MDISNRGRTPLPELDALLLLELPLLLTFAKFVEPDTLNQVSPQIETKNRIANNKLLRNGYYILHILLFFFLLLQTTCNFIITFSPAFYQSNFSFNHFHINHILLGINRKNRKNILHFLQKIF